MHPARVKGEFIKWYEEGFAGAGAVPDFTDETVLHLLMAFEAGTQVEQKRINEVFAREFGYSE